MANGLQRIILRGAECIFVGGTMLPQEAGSPPTARGARIVFFVSIVALGILSLLMIEAWGLDPSVSCPGAFPRRANEQKRSRARGPRDCRCKRSVRFRMGIHFRVFHPGRMQLRYLVGSALERALLTGRALDSPHDFGSTRSPSLRVSSDSRESDDRGGPDNRSGRDLRHRTGRGGPGGLVAPRRALLRPPRFGPRRDGRIQAQSDFRVRERDRDFASSLAEDPGPTPILSMVRDPRRLSTQL